MGRNKVLTAWDRYYYINCLRKLLTFWVFPLCLISQNVAVVNSLSLADNTLILLSTLCWEVKLLNWIELFLVSWQQNKMSGVRQSVVGLAGNSLFSGLFSQKLIHRCPLWLPGRPLFSATVGIDWTFIWHSLVQISR